jgi:hypothetical protein
MTPLGGKFFRTAGESSYHVKPRPQRNESKLTRILFFQSPTVLGAVSFIFSERSILQPCLVLFVGWKGR